MKYLATIIITKEVYADNYETSTQQLLSQYSTVFAGKKKLGEKECQFCTEIYFGSPKGMAEVRLEEC